MCNLSQGIVEKGMEKGMEKGAFNATLASLRRLIANAGMSAEQAMNVLEIPAAERSRYLAAMNYARMPPFARRRTATQKFSSQANCTTKSGCGAFGSQSAFFAVRSKSERFIFARNIMQRTRRCCEKKETWIGSRSCKRPHDCGIFHGKRGFIPQYGRL